MLRVVEDNNGTFDHMNFTEPGTLLNILDIKLNHQYLTKVVLILMRHLMFLSMSK